MSVQIVAMSGEQRFEVYWGGRPVGMVWKAQASWFADRNSLANPAICEASRQAAVDRLIDRIGQTRRPA
jgi:hypothetical protein